jgi:mannose-6-phosphate isomerase-like protein (cupin superfamily)
MLLARGVYEAGRQIPAHEHERAEEVLYILSGHGEIHIGDRVEPVKPGTAVFIPPGESHFLHILSEEPMELIFVFSPPVIPGTYAEAES